jgi:hypothetical protein
VFRDGESILRAIRHLIPFEKNVQDEMLTESRDLIFASGPSRCSSPRSGRLEWLAFALTVCRPRFHGLLIVLFHRARG